MEWLKILSNILNNNINAEQLIDKMKNITKKFILDKNYYLKHWICVLLLRNLIHIILFLIAFGLFFYNIPFFKNTFDKYVVFWKGIIEYSGMIILGVVMLSNCIKRAINILVYIGDEKYPKRAFCNFTALSGLCMYILLSITLLMVYRDIINGYYIVPYNKDRLSLAIIMLGIVSIYIFVLRIIAELRLKEQGLYIYAENKKLSVKINNKRISVDASNDVLLLCDNKEVYYITETGKRRKKNISIVRIGSYVFKWEYGKWKRFKIKAKIRKQVG